MRSSELLRGVLWAGVIGSALLASGCTTAPGLERPNEATSPVANVVGDPSSSPATPDPTGGFPQASEVTEMSPPPPLVAYGVYLEGPGEDAATVDARAHRHAAIEEAIATCMNAQGFQYLPAPQQEWDAWPQASLALRYLPVPLLPPDRESVARFGYGVLAPFEDRLPDGAEGEDPNLAYRQTLSAQEYAAYDKALFGDPSDPAGTSSTSCSGRAVAQHPAPTEPTRQGRFEAEFANLVFAAIFNGREASRNEMEDPRIVALDGEWETCMASRGYPFDGLEPMRGPEMAFFQAERTHPDGTVGPVHRGDVWMSDIPVEEKSLLGTEAERTVALADFDCRDDTNYLSRWTQIRIDLDNEFIDKHRAELDRLVAAAQEW